ncbi:MAG: arsenite transporter [Subtercola sp.]|nr:arsenite transporter [Subtercola sp.]
MTGSGGVRWFERHQVALYLAALAGGAAVGLALPGVAGALEAAITPVLGLLLFATFLGVPIAQLPRALRGGRFVGTVLLLNFVVVPAVVFGLSRFVADDRALLVGVLLVLLAPCVDYVIVFTGLAGGAKDRLLAATPLLMLLQILLLPLFLLLFAGADAVAAMDPAPLVGSFVLLIVLPLALAALVQWCAGRSAGSAGGASPRSSGRRLRAGARAVESAATAAMVPLMMLTLAVVVASQVAAVGAELPALARVVPVYVAFAVVMPVLAVAAARLARLEVPAARAALFSATTRNSLVVLPLALSVSHLWPLAPLAVVTQTLVELIALVVLVALVPRLLPSPPPPPSPPPQPPPTP